MFRSSGVKYLLNLFIDQMCQDSAHTLQTFRAAFIWRVLDCMPVWKVHIDDIDRFVAGFKKGVMVIINEICHF